MNVCGLCASCCPPPPPPPSDPLAQTSNPIPPVTGTCAHRCDKSSSDEMRRVAQREHPAATAHVQEKLVPQHLRKGVGEKPVQGCTVVHAQGTTDSIIKRMLVVRRRRRPSQPTRRQKASPTTVQRDNYLTYSVSATRSEGGWVRMVGGGVDCKQGSPATLPEQREKKKKKRNTRARMITSQPQTLLSPGKKIILDQKTRKTFLLSVQKRPKTRKTKYAFHHRCTQKPQSAAT